MMKQFKFLKSISENTAEKICKNIAVALQLSMLAFYSTKEWIEIIYEKNCIAIRANYDDNIDKYRKLLYNALEWLVKNGIIKDFSLEKALINIDLVANNKNETNS